MSVGTGVLAGTGGIVRCTRVTTRVGVCDGVAVIGSIALGLSVGVLAGVIEMIGIGVAVGASVADGGAGVGVISDTICKDWPGSAMACQPAGSVAC